MAKSKLNKGKPKLKITDMGSTTKSTVKAPKAKSTGSSGGSSGKKKKSTGVKKSSGSTPKKERQYQRPLDPAREKLYALTSVANERYWNLRREGVASRAAIEAERTLTNSHREKYFDTNNEMFTANLPSKREINRELSRVMAFLNDPTSFAPASETFQSQMATGLFGAQWRKDGGGGYDPERVSKSDAEMVFDIYSRVISAGGGWERVIGYFRLMSPGLIDYGSTNLINAIYDMVQNKESINLSDGIEQVEGEIIKRSLQMIDEMRDMYENLAEMQMKGNDYGSILTDKELETNKAYWSYIRSKKG